MNILRVAASGIGDYFLRRRLEKVVVPELLPVLLEELEKHERYDQYNRTAGDLARFAAEHRPIQYDARLQHRKKKSQKQNWKHWRNKR